MRGLKGQNVLVTGGASGIGQATAARFLEEGSRVCVLDRSDEARARVVKELPELVAALDADVAALDQVQAAFAEAIDRMGSVDILINNAGISIRHDFLDITPEEWDQVLDVNLKGVFYVAQTAARHMVDKGSGVIINTAWRWRWSLRPRSGLMRYLQAMCSPRCNERSTLMKCSTQ
jgi:NAD(P)-dependent dehydrogenase (short-subunit alcohol dehydrogenase family)